MKKLVYKVSLGEGKSENPYRKGSFKYDLMAWALDKGEFTQAEFDEALLRIKKEQEHVSVMEDKVLVRAWWNEFKNKHEVFVISE